MIVLSLGKILLISAQAGHKMQEIDNNCSRSTANFLFPLCLRYQSPHARGSRPRMVAFELSRLAEDLHAPHARTRRVNVPSQRPGDCIKEMTNRGESDAQARASPIRMVPGAFESGPADGWPGPAAPPETEMKR